MGKYIKFLSENNKNRFNKQYTLNLVKNYLYAERNGNVARAQSYYEKINEIAQKLNIDVYDIINQGKEHLKKTSVSAILNSIV